MALLESETVNTSILLWWSEGRQRNYGFVNKGKEKILEFQNLKIPNSSGNQCDFSNDLLGKEIAGFGVEVMSIINGIVTNGIKGKLTLDRSEEHTSELQSP